MEQFFSIQQRFGWKRSFSKMILVYCTSPYRTQVLSYRHPLSLPAHGRPRCYAHSKDYFAETAPKSGVASIRIPSGTPAAVAKAINQPQRLLQDGEITSFPSNLQRAESGAPGRAHSISHPEETWAAGGSPGPHPPHLGIFLIARPLAKIEQTSLRRLRYRPSSAYVMTWDIIHCSALN